MLYCIVTISNNYEYNKQKTSIIYYVYNMYIHIKFIKS